MSLSRSKPPLHPNTVLAMQKSNAAMQMLLKKLYDEGEYDDVLQKCYEYKLKLSSSSWISAALKKIEEAKNHHCSREVYAYFERLSGIDRYPRFRQIASNALSVKLEPIMIPTRVPMSPEINELYYAGEFPEFLSACIQAKLAFSGIKEMVVKALTVIEHKDYHCNAEVY